jgi:hypothetical protein
MHQLKSISSSPFLSLSSSERKKASIQLVLFGFGFCLSLDKLTQNPAIAQQLTIVGHNGKHKKASWRLHEVASTGASLMTSFAKLLAYRKVPDNSLENLYATISITSSSLRKLGNTINEHEKDFSVKDEITKPIIWKCKENFDKLLVFVNEAVSQGIWKQDGTIDGITVTSETGLWVLITLGIGGWENAENFWKGLNVVRDILPRLNDTVKYMILKNLKER